MTGATGRGDSNGPNTHTHTLIDINGGDRLSVFCVKILIMLEACVRPPLSSSSLLFSHLLLSTLLLFHSSCLLRSPLSPLRLYMPQLSTEGQHRGEMSVAGGNKRALLPADEYE